MATAKDLSKSITQSSEEVFDTCCTPCSDSGRTKEAEKFCVDCGSYFCAKCLIHHNKFPALKLHQILDKSKQDSEQDRQQEENSGIWTSVPTEKCTLHLRKLVDMYCKDHDEVCCAACVAIKHRACVNIDYLPDIVKGIGESAEYNDIKAAFQNIITKMKQEKERRNDVLRNIGKQKDQLLEEVDNLKKDLISKITELAESSKKQICSKHEDNSKAIQSVLETLDTLITNTTANEQKLASKNEAQLFVTITSSKVLIKECEVLLEDILLNRTNEELLLHLNKETKDKLQSFVLVNEIKEIKEYTANLYGKIKIDSDFCEITGICVMDDGTFVIADYTNHCLKRLASNYAVSEHLSVGGRPWSVCRVDSNEVAVFVSRKDIIQIVHVGQKMVLQSSFQANRLTVGVSYDAEKNTLLACCDDQVLVYNRSGSLLKAYEKSESVEKMFISAKQLALNAFNQVMFVTDYGAGKLFALTKHGKIIWTFGDQNLKQPWGVCVLPGDIILVSGLESNNVLQVNKEGEKIRELIGISDKISRPYAFAYDRNNSRLLIGCSNEMHVYTLCKHFIST